MKGTRTVASNLFAFGWPMRHRVLVNAAVSRWGDGPRAVRAVNARSARGGGMLPLGLMKVYPYLHTVHSPVYTPGPALAGMPDRVVAVTPLYAGESVARIDDIVPAAVALARLANRPI